jgi:16S rRNA (adenine1518-N6/adenine1519-N6)-dimethyltransferase
MSLLKQTLFDLENLENFPSKRLGQNFLIDIHIVNKIVALADVKTSDVVIEIGPGLAAILEKFLNIGAKLFAVELDWRLFNFLNPKFASSSNLCLPHADAVDFPVAGLPQNIIEFKIISKLPYSISSTWMDALLEYPNLPQSINLITQAEMAQRFSASTRPSEICPISIFIQSAYDKVCMCKVAASSFHPEPTMSSTIVSIVKKRACSFSNCGQNRLLGVFLQKEKTNG